MFLFGLIAEVQKQVPSVEEGEVLKPLMKCYTALEVSSSKSDISKYDNFHFDLTECVSKLVKTRLLQKVVDVLKGVIFLVSILYYSIQLPYRKILWEVI